MMVIVKSGTYRAITVECIWSNSSFQIAHKTCRLFFDICRKINRNTETKGASYHSGSMAEFIFPSVPICSVTPFFFLANIMCKLLGQLGCPSFQQIITIMMMIVIWIGFIIWTECKARAENSSTEKKKTHLAA